MPARLQLRRLAPNLIATATIEDLTWAASLEVTDIFDVAG